MGNWTSRGNGKQETTGLDHHVRRTAINNGNDSRDSSIYNTIQFDIPFASHGPMELGLTNSKSSAQSLKAITSLEYTVVTDNIIESSSPSEQQTYQSLNKRTLDIASYNLEPLERSSYSSNTQNPARAEINVSADRNYFKLEPCSTTASDMESGEQEGDDRSAYFVLEKSGTSHSSIDPPDVSYSEPSHETHVGNID
ncbi:hypothetical protein DPMN_117994 [Dreissena polymorpha]|uniref:Uncharacterized protein n=1 Tax=Dreissena polymorpha TaxID=45954 RepID=A0A9D4GJD1_DREPO|nr:hypothetical protein DPMN_117994 [Dreissena polymorpha]